MHSDVTAQGRIARLKTARRIVWKSQTTIYSGPIDTRPCRARTLLCAVEELVGDGGRGQVARRVCARVGCGTAVKKPTAKYCSVRCCAIDPERHERLRAQARRTSARPLTMARQLSLNVTFDAEAQLAQLCQGREDAPAGMSRLAAS